MPLIHTYNYGDGGIGDFLRSVFAYFVFCKKNNINYYLYIQDHPFERCFKNQSIPIEHTTNLTQLLNIAGESNEDTTKIISIGKESDEFLIRIKGLLDIASKSKHIPYSNSQIRINAPSIV